MMKRLRVLFLILMVIILSTIITFLSSRLSPVLLPHYDNNNLLLFVTIVSSIIAFLAASKDTIELFEKITSWISPKKASETQSPTSQQLTQYQRARQILLQRVRAIWIKGLLENSIHGVAYLELGLNYSPDSVERPWPICLAQPQQGNEIIPTNKAIADIFNESGGYLLILGAPGAGKTTTLLNLARKLLDDAERDENLPLPLILNLTSWSSKHQKLTDWLVEELNTLYQLNKRFGLNWLDTEPFCLLLDGLDEVQESLRHACIQAINQFRQSYGLTKLVICSRKDDYEQLTQQLQLHTAVVIQPLTLAQVEAYLSAGGEKMMAARMAIATDALLRELSQTPLTLSIITLAYQGKDINELTVGTLQQRRQQLFANYVDRMFERRPPRDAFVPQQAKRWLSWLAQQLQNHSQSVFFLEEISPDWVFGRYQYRKWAALIAGLIAAVIIGLPGGWLLGYVMQSTALGVVFASCSTINLLLLHALTGFHRESKADKTISVISIAKTTLIILLVTSLPGAVLMTIAANTLELSLEVSFFKKVFTFFRLFAWSQGLPIAIVNILEATKKRNWLNVFGHRLQWSASFGLPGFLANVFTNLEYALSMAIILGMVGFANYSLRRFSYNLFQANLNLVETIEWSMRKMFGGFIAGLGISILFFWVFNRNMIIMLFGLYLGIMGGVYVSAKPRNLEIRMTPNIGIHLTGKNALRIGIFVSLPVIFFFGGTFVLTGGWRQGLFAGLVSGLTVFTIAFLKKGGLAVVKHYFLRFVLSQKNLFPFNYTQFLESMADHIILRRVGGGYIFIHRMLLEYFANLYASDDR